jgi:hypothetical protein
MVSKGKRSKGIRLPDFVELKSGKSRAGEVQCIRIISRDASAKHPAQGFIYFPAALVDNKKGAEYTLGVKYGTNTAWINFVAEYTEYAVSKWKDIQGARLWLRTQRRKFIKLVQSLWKFRGGNDVPANRVWAIRPSTLPPDPEYIKKKHFPARSANDPGYGLYCTKPGQHLIWYDGPTTIRKPPPPTDLESEYMASIIDTDDIIVPSQDAFDTWALHHSFLVGHKRIRLDPTHEPCCMKDDTGEYRPCLKPLRDAKKDEEFCFDYGKHLEGAKDVATAEDLLLLANNNR